MRSAVTFSRAAADLLQRLPLKVQRNGRKLAANTLKFYAKSVERTEPVILAGKAFGDIPLNRITNEVIRDLIIALREDYKAATICSDITVVKMVVHSITKNAQPVFPLRIDPKFVCLPFVDPEEQHTPCATRDDVERALLHPELAGPIAVAAGAGLRISEILALHVGDYPGLDCWDGDAGIIHVRKTLKTLSSKRSIPIPQLNAFLQEIAAGKAGGDILFTVPLNRLYNLLESRKLPTPHAYRRFFDTTMDVRGMNRSVLKKIMGHGKVRSDMTEKYSHVDKDMDFLRSEMTRCDLGFSLPATIPARVPHEDAMAVIA